MKRVTERAQLHKRTHNSVKREIERCGKGFVHRPNAMVAAVRESRRRRRGTTVQILKAVERSSEVDKVTPAAPPPRSDAPTANLAPTRHITPTTAQSETHNRRS